MENAHIAASDTWPWADWHLFSAVVPEEATPRWRSEGRWIGFLFFAGGGRIASARPSGGMPVGVSPVGRSGARAPDTAALMSSGGRCLLSFFLMASAARLPCILAPVVVSYRYTRDR